MPRSRQRKKSGRGKSSRRRFSFGDDGVGQKMSEVLLEFIEPYRDEALDDAALEKLIAPGIVAWNVVLLPPDKREAALDDFCAKLFRRRWTVLLGRLGSWLHSLTGRRRGTTADAEPSEIADFKQLAHELIQRKLQHYPYNRRFIMSYQLSTTEDDVHLVIASTLPP